VSLYDPETPVSQTILLVGRTRMIIDDARVALGLSDAGFSAATNLAEVEEALQAHQVSHVFIGAGIELEQRLGIVRAIFQNSETTTVHLKDSASGPSGFLPFVRAILSGLPH
jgi:hypothetical protein